MNDDTLPRTPGNDDRTIADLPTLKGIDTVASNTSKSDASADTELRGSGEERYGIGSELARGGMGAVLNAKDLNLRRDVAMKIVLKPEAAQKEQILRFVHEAQVTGQLEHPSIVPVYELGVDSEGKVYYTMKYIRGTNLGDILNGIRNGDHDLRSAYPLTRLLNIFIKTCDALAFAHSRGVIHRDLKPDNIMVGDFGEVLVVDWGLAKVLGESAPHPDATTKEMGRDIFVESIRDGDSGSAMNTMDGAVMGTPAYMAPEQAGGDVGRMGTPADIYAMGAILYAILTLEAPFAGENVHVILNKVLAGDFNAPAHYADELPHCPTGKVPSALSAVVMKAMAMEPEDRYDKVKALQTDVQAYLDGFATSAEEAGLWRLVQLFVARHKAMVISASIGAAFLTVVVAVAFVVNVKARQAAELARVDAVNSRGKAEESLRIFKEEQARGQEVRRKAAPALVNAAKGMIERDDLEGAAFQVDLARKYDPTFAAAHMLKAQLFIVAGDYTQALAALSEYRALVPDDMAAKQLEELCGQEESMWKEELQMAFTKVFGSQKAWQLADRIKRELDRDFELHKKRLQEAWPRWGKADHHYQRRPDGLLLVQELPGGATDLSPLKGMPIGELGLSAQFELSDLSPLRGMPLQVLRINRTKVADLSPLTGAPLKVLFAERTQIHDLSPLAGMPLHTLNLESTKVADLSPLAGAPLHTLDLTATKAADLSPLAGMPLRNLRMRSMLGLTDLSALKDMPLQTLEIWQTGVTDFSPLTSCISLEEVTILNNPSKDMSPLSSLKLKRAVLDDQKNLNFLAGAPLEELLLTRCDALTDLSPLKGMPLRKLEFNYSANSLDDLSPLEGLPLQKLRIDEAKKLKDLSVIRTLESLEGLKLPEQFKTIDFLNELPNLKRISIAGLFSGKPEEFREHQAKLLREKTKEAK